jgi:branched-chain amino acid transport system permease protein
LAGSVKIFGITYSTYRCFLIFVGFALAIALWLLEDKTKIGAIIRAGVDDLQMLEAMGKNAKLIFTLVFVLGGALAGLAGVLGSIITGSSLGVADEVLILSLVILVIGGMGSLKGAMVGSLIVGFADVFGRAYIPELAYFVVFGVMVAVLVWKPSGLLGETK